MKKTFALFLIVCSMSCNFRTVQKKQLYRMGQPDKSTLIETIADYEIKTVINLRGENPDADWYKEELEAVQQTGVHHINIRMSSKRIPRRSQLLKLIHSFENSPRPILVHCAAGIDRTGEASAMWVLDQMGKSKKEALKMLSAKYFYFEKFKPAKKYFIRDIYQGSQWAKDHYFPCRADYKYFDKVSLCTNGKESSKPDPDIDDDEDYNDIPEEEYEDFQKSL